MRRLFKVTQISQITRITFTSTTDLHGFTRMIFSHADLADLADNLYFDHGFERIYTDKRKSLKSLESLDDHGFSKKLKTKNSEQYLTQISQITQIYSEKFGDKKEITYLCKGRRKE